MENIIKQFKRVYLRSLITSIIALFIVVGIVQAATTISANVSTGAITATGNVALNGGTLIYNSSAANKDASFYGATNATDPMLFLDASTWRVGIGTSSPDVGLHIGSTTPAHISGYRDAMASGNLEVDGVAWFDGSLRASSTLFATGATTLYNTLTATTTAITANNNSTAVLTVRQNAATGNIVNITDAGTSVFTIGPAGDVDIIRTSTTALSVQNATNAPIFEVDTTNSRASTTGIIVPQAASTAPRFNASSTAVSIGDGTPIAGLLFGTCVVDIPNTVASSTSVANCTATGVTTSYNVFVTPNSTSSSIVFRSASSTADNTIQVSVHNTGYGATGSIVGAINPEASTWTWMAIR